ncbi:unnamed protein product [Thelazia callipaeda]|uniref:Protein kinase domain-containing protein n=1 Tax=Thelazia callipaeda TaxID=103827 RepID=A0A0N5CY96_THECL|nr:unnamed protein product [Thelazia callipaeda]
MTNFIVFVGISVHKKRQEAMNAQKKMNDNTLHTVPEESEKNSANRTDICTVIRNGLLEIMIDGKQQQILSAVNTKIRIKAEFRGEKFCFEMFRPILFDELQAHLHSRCNQKLSIYYTQRNYELIAPIRNQLELDHAVELLDLANTSNHRSLRILLSRHQAETWLPQSLGYSQIPDASGTFSVRSSKIIELPYKDCRSSCTSTSTGTVSSSWQNTSSVSSGVILTDFDEHSVVGISTPRPPTNWKQGKCIGSGTFGKVYLCVDVDTGKELALKRFEICYGHKHLQNHIIQLENEINLLSTIQHYRIVQYFGAQQIKDAICIFMEFMTGGSVKDCISVYGPLSSTVARKYTYQVLQGLQYLHDNEIIHRDIKPANILRDSNGNVKIGDFGSAKRLQAICSQQASAYIGTPNYMAPEVALGCAGHGRKADIWSVGCTLVEMLTAKPLWDHLEPMAIIFNIVRKKPTYELPNDTDEVLVRFIEMTLERDIEKRPSASFLLSHLASISNC